MRIRQATVNSTTSGRTPWAPGADSDVAIWHVTLELGASWTMPPTGHPDTVRTVYLFEGDRLEIGGDSLESSTGAVVRSNQPTMLISDPSGEVDTQLLVLHGRPINEPVAQYGPFVMNAGLGAASRSAARVSLRSPARSNRLFRDAEDVADGLRRAGGCRGRDVESR